MNVFNCCTMVNETRFIGIALLATHRLFPRWNVITIDIKFYQVALEVKSSFYIVFFNSTYCDGRPEKTTKFKKNIYIGWHDLERTEGDPSERDGRRERTNKWQPAKTRPSTVHQYFRGLPKPWILETKFQLTTMNRQEI
jgi:hypothetical protein